MELYDTSIEPQIVDKNDTLEQALVKLWRHEYDDTPPDTMDFDEFCAVCDYVEAMAFQCLCIDTQCAADLSTGESLDPLGAIAFDNYYRLYIVAVWFLRYIIGEDGCWSDLDAAINLVNRINENTTDDEVFAVCKKVGDEWVVCDSEDVKA